MLDLLNPKTGSELLKSIRYAAEIQAGLLPKDRHFKKFCSDYAVFWCPNSTLSGDFYWVGQKEGKYYMAVADCTGHGIPASLLTVMGISLLNYVVLGKNFSTTGQCLEEIDKKWIETFQNDTDEMFNNDWMEISLLQYDPVRKSLQYSAAISKFVVYNSRTNYLQLFRGNHYPIGGWQIEKNRKYYTGEYLLKENDELYLFTDGIMDQFGGDDDKKFGLKQFLEIIRTGEGMGVCPTISCIEKKFLEWKGGREQTDDVTVVGMGGFQ